MYTRGGSNSIAKYCNTFGILQYLLLYFEILQQVLQNLEFFAILSAKQISKYSNKYCKIPKVLQYFTILLEPPLSTVVILK